MWSCATEQPKSIVKIPVKGGAAHLTSIDGALSIGIIDEVANFKGLDLGIVYEQAPPPDPARLLRSRDRDPLHSEGLDNFRVLKIDVNDSESFQHAVSIVEIE